MRQERKEKFQQNQQMTDAIRNNEIMPFKVAVIFLCCTNDAC